MNGIKSAVRKALPSGTASPQSTDDYIPTEDGDGLERENTTKPPDMPPEALTPSQLRIPSYLMCAPFTISNKAANNAWMKQERPINRELAFSQWLQLNQFLAANSLMNLLPCEGMFQDLVYVANIGMMLPHIKKPTVILSKYTSPPRKGEELVAKPFFEMSKYRTVMSPIEWEGEAETKWLHDNVYAGGYGIRTKKEVYDWMEKTFGMKVIRVKETDEHLYHFDCELFPLTSEKTIACTELMTDAEVKALEAETGIIPVTAKQAHAGITNCVRCGNMVCCASELPSMRQKDPEYAQVKNVVDTLNKICVDNALESVWFNLSELELSGAALSCCVMHLSRVDTATEIVA
jgi:N-dimethylarginine dimethylaminohydrolase